MILGMELIVFRVTKVSIVDIVGKFASDERMSSGDNHPTSKSLFFDGDSQRRIRRYESTCPFIYSEDDNFDGFWSTTNIIQGSPNESMLHQHVERVREPL
jgi:hypothetical protein